MQEAALDLVRKFVVVDARRNFRIDEWHDHGPAPTAKTPNSTPFASASRPFEQRMAELEEAIASITRTLGAVPDEAVVLLVGERAEKGSELRGAERISVDDQTREARQGPGGGIGEVSRNLRHLPYRAKSSGP